MNGDITRRPGAQAFIRPRDDGRSKRLHAGLVIGLPTLAVLVALAQAALGSVQAWHVVMAVVAYVLTFGGITVGFHRMVCHKAFEAAPAAKAVLLALGCAGAQGPPIYWTGHHRIHHRFSDQPGDPHSPYWSRDDRRIGLLAGAWNVHVGWLLDPRTPNTAVYCKDLFKDPMVLWFNHRYHVWLLIGLVVPAAIGLLIERSAIGALQGLLWGGGVRIFMSHHVNAAIGSVCHIFGSRPYATREHSRNNFVVGVIALGDGWHNNHHACPSAAFHGFHWWQIDLGGYLIRALEMTGLARNVVRPDPAILAKLRAGGAP
jgi:stearoyl-CoA desaturase (Delta-9 desaturase)